MIGFIAGPIERNRHEECICGRRMGGNDPSAWRQWRIRVSNTRWGQFSTRSGKRTSKAFRTVFDRGAASMMHWTRSTALKRRVGITRKKVNWVLDLDVQSFFDKIEHKWLV